MQEKPRHGWFSLQAANTCGSVYYEDANGIPIEVTAVTVDRAGEAYQWKDKVYVGEVGKYLYQGREGEEKSVSDVPYELRDGVAL